MMRWVYSKQGTIVLSVMPLLIGIAALYGFWRWGGAIIIVTGVVILGLVIFEWIRLYRHRDDPDWPRRPAWVARDKP
jgi:fatty acid desaturase